MKIFKINNKGFTVLELLVVIGIIGLLTAIVLAFMAGARDKSKDALIKREMQEARSEAEIYHTEFNTYEYDISGNDADPTNDTVCDRFSKFAPAVFQNLNGLPDGTKIATCEHTSDKWAAEVSLNATEEIWCTDSTGYIGPAVLQGNRVCDGSISCQVLPPAYDANPGAYAAFFECDRP
jgi:prepilin-type N-terminal cleavage/methylation domain-containing protein